MVIPPGAQALYQRRPTTLSSNLAYDEAENALDILLVEDDYGDMLMTLQAINGSSLPYRLNRLTHGDDVMPYLTGATQTRMPDLILLDMGLPGTDGFEILESIAAAPAQLRGVPIAIITMYANFEYLNKTYDLPIYGYLTKPIKADKMREVLTRVADFTAASRN